MATAGFPQRAGKGKGKLESCWSCLKAHVTAGDHNRQWDGRPLSGDRTQCRGEFSCRGAFQEELSGFLTFQGSSVLGVSYKVTLPSLRSSPQAEKKSTNSFQPWVENPG